MEIILGKNVFVFSVDFNMYLNRVKPRGDSPALWTLLEFIKVHGFSDFEQKPGGA